MKSFLLTLLIPAITLSATAQEAFEARTVLSTKDGKNLVGWIVDASKTQIRYKESPAATAFTNANIKDFDVIYFMEPAEFSAAMDLYEAGKYEEAKAEFIKFKDRSKIVANIEDNFHTLSAFYEMESLRNLGDYEGLATALQSFSKEPLSRAHHLRQLDLYVMWDAVKSKSWDRVLSIASEREGEELPGYQRVQVAYAKGLALQNTDRSPEAIIAYTTALTADAGASETLVNQAALNLLEIYNKDEEVQAALAAWGTDNEKKNSPGYARLKEAAALARIYEQLLNTGKALPEPYKAFLKVEEKKES